MSSQVQASLEMTPHDPKATPAPGYQSARGAITADTVKVPLGTEVDANGHVNVPTDSEAIRQAAEEAEQNQEPQPPEKEPPVSPEEAAKAAEDIEKQNPDKFRDAALKVGVDYDALSAEYAKTGTLSEESVKKASEAMAKHGVENGGAILHDIVNSRQVAQQMLNSEFVRMAGGEDSWNSAVTWAQSKEAPPGVKAVLENASKAGNTVVQALEAAQYIVDQFKRNGPVQGARLEAATGVRADGAELFHSQDELALAMAKPEYRTDPKYRAKIQRLIIASRQAGTLLM